MRSPRSLPCGPKTLPIVYEWGNWVMGREGNRQGLTAVWEPHAPFSWLCRGPRPWAKLRFKCGSYLPWKCLELLRRILGQGQNKASFHGNPDLVTSQSQDFTEKLHQKECSFISPKAWNSWFETGSFCLWKKTRKRCCNVALPTMKKEEKGEENRFGIQNRKGLLPLYR